MSDVVLRRQSSTATSQGGEAMDMSAFKREEEQQLPKPPRYGGSAVHLIYSE